MSVGDIADGIVADYCRAASRIGCGCLILVLLLLLAPIYWIAS